ncbi:MAG: putative ski2-type helicase [Candidatus Heimdallarchaeota archaeon LC_3]|nr:MAG: putative ski2-type helicase [Candidatus Heimdallarchaeota archaeon LC_3]
MVDIKEFETKIGFKLHDWQKRALKSIVGKNRIMIEAPTSSGKTLIAVKMAIEIFKNSDTFVLFVTPLNQLVNEHISTLRKQFKDMGVNISSNYKTIREYSKNLLVTTPESLFNQLTLINEYLFSINLLIIDEIHLVGSKFRGPKFELSISLLLMSANQVIALSATMGERTKIKDWIDADLELIEDFRLIQIREEIINTKGKLNEALTSLIDLFQEQTIVFRGKLDWTESSSLFLAENVKLEDKKLAQLKQLINSKMREKWKSKADLKWIKCFEAGFPYHHSKIREKQKDLVIKAFENDLAKAIVATPTLMMGVNLPADQIIIADKMIGGKSITSIDLRQMIGRAGRPGKSKTNIGYAKMLISDDKNIEFYQQLLKDQGRIISHLDSTSALLPLLNMISTGLIGTEEVIEELKHHTYERPRRVRAKQVAKKFGTSLEQLLGTRHPINLAINELERINALEIDNGKFIISEFGSLCINFQLQPDEAFNLSNSKIGMVGIGSFEFFEIFLDNLYNDFRPSVRQKDSVDVAKKTINETGEIYNPDHWTMREVGIIILWSLTQGKSIDECSEYFGVYPNSIEQIVISIAKWIESIALHPSMFHIVEADISKLEKIPNQLRFGLSEKEVEFSFIPDVKHERAKALANKFDSLNKLINAKISDIADVKVKNIKIGSSRAHKIRNNAEMDNYNQHLLLRCPDCEYSYIFVELNEFGSFHCLECDSVNSFTTLIRENRYCIIDTCCLVNQMFSKLTTEEIPIDLNYYVSGWTLAELRSLEKKAGQKEQGKNGFRELTFLERELNDKQLKIEPEKTVQDLGKQRSGDAHFVDHTLIELTAKIKGYFITEDENTARTTELKKVPVLFFNNNTGS